MHMKHAGKSQVRVSWKITEHGPGKAVIWQLFPLVSPNPFTTIFLLWWQTPQWSVAVLSTDDLMPNVPISCLPPSHVDPEVQGLKIIVVVLSQVILGRPIGKWSKCGGNETMMVLLGSSTSKVPKETQPEWLDPAQHWWAGSDASHCILSSVSGVRNK